MVNRHDQATGVEELLQRARDGDQQAEERLFSRLHARILALAKRRLQDEEAARDIAQETMRTVFEKYRTAPLPRGLLPWAFAILRNKVGNQYKRRRVEGRHQARVDEAWLAETVGTSPDNERAALDLLRRIRGALTNASGECRRIFDLLLSGADRHVIREAFGGAPLGTIDSRISRCRKRLLEQLDWAERRR